MIDETNVQATDEFTTVSFKFTAITIDNINPFID